MFDAGIGLEDIKHFLHHFNEAQTESCIVNLSVQCIANRFGCKVDEMNLHFLECVDTEVPFSSRKAGAPWLYEAWGKAKVEYQKCKNMKELQSKYLVTEMGSL